MQRTPLAPIIAGLFVLPVQAQQIPTLDEIIVTATRIPTPSHELLRDASSLEHPALLQMADTTVTELIAGLPGVQVTTVGGRGDASTFSVRGANAAHNVVFVDGLRISSATLGISAIHAMPTALFDRVELVRGPLSSLYGTDAMSGVLQLMTPDPWSATLPMVQLGAGSHGTVGGFARLGGVQGDNAFSIQAATEHSDGFSSIKSAKVGFFDMYNPDRDAFDNRFFNAAYSHRLSADTVVDARYLYSDSTKHYDATNCDAFFVTCTTQFDNRNNQIVESAQATLANTFSQNWSSKLRLGRSRDQQKNWLFDPVTTGVTVDEYETEQDQVTWQNDLTVPGGKAMIGLEWRGIDVASTKVFVVNEQTTKSFMAGYQGRFGQHQVELSGRQDDVSLLGKHSSYSVGYGYNLSSKWSTRVVFGTAFHAPNFNDLYWPLDPVNFYQGNPALKPESARNQEWGLVYADKNASAKVTLYRNRVSDLIDYVAGVAPTFIGTMGNLNSATLQGATLEYTRSSGAWSVHAVADWLSAKDDATGLTLQRRAPKTASLAVTHQAGALTLSGQLRAVSARFNNAANTQKLAGYGVVNLSGQYRWNSAWAVEARLDNLFDRDYVEVRSTLSPFNDYAVPGRTAFVGLRYAPK